MPDLSFKIMMNVGNPDRAFDFQSLPNAGVGLARLEFIINRMIGVHPKALLNFDSLPEEVKPTVKRRIAGYASPVDFYVDKLVEGISTLAAAFWPKPDRKSTRLNSSHVRISYAVFCLKKKK